MQKIKVDAREILFFQENAPKAIVSLIMESLSEKQIKINRIQVHREITTIKKLYIKDVIDEARRLIKAINGVEFDEDKIHVRDI